MPKQLSVHPDLLRPNPWNTNFVSPENEAKLAESMRQLGMFKPIVVREKPDDSTQYEILGGEHRWQEAKRAGMTEVPIFNLGAISDELAKKISLADNARYGADDTLKLSELLSDLGTAEDLSQLLPYTQTDLEAVFSASNIALDELDLDEKFETDEKAPDEPKVAKAPKTHTVMRFKVPVGDAERITELIAKTQKHHGLTSSDELTNAGDALVQLLFNGAGDE